MVVKWLYATILHHIALPTNVRKVAFLRALARISSVGRAAVSKTACRGFEPFCPCKKSGIAFAVPDFSLVCGRFGNEVRPQARLRCVSWGECVPVARKLRADRGGRRDKAFCPCQKNRPKLEPPPFVRQYGKLLMNGVLFYAKGIPKKKIHRRVQTRSCRDDDARKTKLPGSSSSV